MKALSICLPCALLLVSAVPASAQLFETGFYVAVGGQPTDVVAAELNGEPGLDLATANGNNLTVSVIFSLGDGTYTEPVVYGLAGSALTWSIVATDIDEDQDLDLVVGRNISIVILINDGAGNFSEGDSFTLEGYHIEKGLCAADLDGDEDNDLLATEGPFGGGLWLIENEGLGVLAEPLEIYPTRAWHPVVADLNDDPHPDVAFHTGIGGDVVVMLGEPGVEFADPFIYEFDVNYGLAGLAAADLDGDEDIDLTVISASASAHVLQLTNLGDGSFADGGEIADPVSYWGRDLCAAQLDDNGCAEVIPVCEEPWHQVGVNDCEGNFEMQYIGPDASAGTVTTADVDGDTDLDLIYALSEADSVLIHLNTLVTETGVGYDELPASGVLRLDRIYPNPFNPQTVISYSVPVAGAVRLAVYDLRGRLVRVLVDGALAMGPHTATWHGRNDAGQEMPGGVYLLRLEAGGEVARDRMTLVK